MDPQGSPLPATTEVRRNVSRRIAGAYFLFAGAWIVISDLTLLELASDLPNFAGASLVKGGLFVLITTVLLYLFSSQQLRTITESGLLPIDADTPRLARLNPAVVFSAMAVLAIVLVIAMFSIESGQHRDAAREQLRAILELKADQIELLLEQRQAAARSYSRSRGLHEDMARHALRPAENIGQGIKDRLENLRRDLAFDAVLVLDRAGLLVAGSASDTLLKPSPEIVSQAKRSMASATPISHYLHRETQLPGEPVLLDYITPLRATADGQEMLGVIVLRENAHNRIFHLIQQWPTASPTAETLLVRRDGDTVLFLNDVRHVRDTAFRLRRPLSDTDFVAAKAVQATAPLLTDGNDYRGTRVVAASRSIAGTDWFLIAKIDRDEVLAPVRRSALIWLGSILCMSLLAAIGVWWLWRQQLRLTAANWRTETTAREALGKHLDLLSRHASDAILLVDMQGQIREANERAVERYGYPRDELIGMPVAKLRSPEETSSLDDRLAGIRQRGSDLHESLHITRSGITFPVEINAHLVETDGGHFIQAIIRDITESKRSVARIARLTHLRDMSREVNRTIVHAASEDALFTETCTTAVRHGGFVLAWIGTLDEKSGTVIPLASAGDRAGLEYLSRIKVSYHDVPEGRGPTGTAIHEGRVIVANDLLEDPRSTPWHEAARDTGIRSSVALPLQRSGEVVAVLNVYADTMDYFDAEMLSLLEEMARDVSYSLNVRAGDRERKHAEEALRTSQQIIEGILNAIPVRVFWKDRKLVYLGCNAIFALDAGFADPKDVIGKDDYQMGWRDQAELYRADDLQVIESGRPKFLVEEPQTTPEGNTITLLTSKLPLRNSMGEISGVLGTYLDITERKRAETEGRNRLDRVQRQMEAVGRISASDALLTGDVERLAREITEEAARVAAVERANVWLFNENETELRCIDLYEATPKTHTAGAILHQENFENEFHALKNARCVDADDPLTDPRTVGYIEDYLKPLRITSMLDAVVQISGKNLGLLCLEHVDQPHHWEQDEITFVSQLADKIGLAITSRTRQQALESMEESERRFRTLVEQSVSGFYMIQDGKIAYVNSRFAEIFGYASPDEIIGKNPLDIVAAKDRATVAENFRKRLAGEIKSISYSFTGLRKDGSEIELGAHGAYVINEGRPAVIGLLQDISERKRNEDEIRRYVAQLEQAMRGTIGVISAIGEARDPYTHGHERRVGEIAAAIGTEMGLDANRIEGIRISGYMHDVGKIAVPAEILSKPGKLTKPEYELVKAHAERGYEILKSFEFPWPVAEIAWQHHERLDGSGYPRGLKGDEILLDARILAVADTIEAMSSHRPYRPGLGIEQALAEISKGSGTQYDPQAVDACRRLFIDKSYQLPE